MLVNAIQAAYNLNLHRDDGIDHKYNLEEREDRRRLWSMLFAADALFEQGRTYFISSHHADTRVNFPSRLDSVLPDYSNRTDAVPLR